MEAFKNTILVVDDNTVNLQVVGSLLKDKDYNIVLAKDGKSALKVLEHVVPDIMLFDIMMPEMDGYTLCEIVKRDEKYASVPVIFITAKIEPEDIVKGFEVGAVDYVLKPFNKKVLLARITNHLAIRQAQRTIEKQKEVLEEMVDVRDKMFSIIAHDLRGPISNLKMFVDMVQEMPGSISYEKAMAVIEKTTTESFNLINNLLSWARLKCNNKENSKENINLYVLVEDLIYTHRYSAEAKNISVKNFIVIDQEVTSDTALLQTVLRNLLSNALKFTPKGGVVEVLYREDDDFFHISIKDNGIGMSQEDIQKIFDPAIIHSTYGTEDEKGNGLGLNLCRDFIERAGGIFTIESEIMRGSSFNFALPKK